MQRRDFLRGLLGTLVSSQLDVEKLLWIPDKKAIFIPSQRQIGFFYGGARGGGKTLLLHPSQYAVYIKLLQDVETKKQS